MNSFKRMKNKLKKTVVILGLSFFFLPAGRAQEKDSSEIMIGIVEGEDTIIHKELKEIWVMPPKQFKNRRQERRYNRYVRKVKKVYPYAKMAGELLKKYEP